jgi:membrane-bound serine protease (ClpP class)
LILLAIGLFALEATMTSHGILAMGGIASMTAGAVMLVQGPIPQLRVQLSTALAVTIPVAIITVFLVRLVYLSRKRKSIVGTDSMIGEEGIAKSDINPDGRVFVHGEYWNASSEKPIPAGSKIRVRKVHGLKVDVEQL